MAKPEILVPMEVFPTLEHNVFKAAAVDYSKRNGGALSCCVQQFGLVICPHNMYGSEAARRLVSGDAARATAGPRQGWEITAPARRVALAEFGQRPKGCECDGEGTCSLTKGGVATRQGSQYLAAGRSLSQDGTELGVWRPTAGTDEAVFVADGDLGVSVTDPLVADSDTDLLDDGVEDANLNGVFDSGETDPNVQDTDGDLLLDGEEDADHDGEVGDGETSPILPDTDYDGLDDYYELNTVYGYSEIDWDGTPGVDYKTDPTNIDTDGDGVSDGDELNSWEDVQIYYEYTYEMKGDPYPVSSSEPLDPDTDNDGMSDGDEFVWGGDPWDTDTDDDGYSDGVEETYGSAVNGIEGGAPTLVSFDLDKNFDPSRKVDTIKGIPIYSPVVEITVKVVAQDPTGIDKIDVMISGSELVQKESQDGDTFEYKFVFILPTNILSIVWSGWDIDVMVTDNGQAKATASEHVDSVIEELTAFIDETRNAIMRNGEEAMKAIIQKQMESGYKLLSKEILEGKREAIELASYIMNLPFFDKDEEDIGLSDNEAEAIINDMSSIYPNSIILQLIDTGLDILYSILEIFLALALFIVLFIVGVLVLLIQLAIAVAITVGVIWGLIQLFKFTYGGVVSDRDRPGENVGRTGNYRTFDVDNEENKIVTEVKESASNNHNNHIPTTAGKLGDFAEKVNYPTIGNPTLVTIKPSGSSVSIENIEIYVRINTKTKIQYGNGLVLEENNRWDGVTDITEIKMIATREFGSIVPEADLSIIGSKEIKKWEESEIINTGDMEMTKYRYYTFKLYQFECSLEKDDLVDYQSERILWDLKIKLQDREIRSYHSIATYPVMIEDKYKFIQITDTHLGRTFGTNAIRKSGDLVSIFKEVGFDYDFALITGDITEIGHEAEVWSFMNLIIRYAELPVFIIPGNHDWGLDDKGLGDIYNYEKYINPSFEYIYPEIELWSNAYTPTWNHDFAFEWGKNDDNLFIVSDSGDNNWETFVNYYIRGQKSGTGVKCVGLSDSQLGWMKEVVKEYDPIDEAGSENKQVFVFTHAPFCGFDLKWSHDDNDKEFIDWTNGLDTTYPEGTMIEIAVSGHTHNNRVFVEVQTTDSTEPTYYNSPKHSEGGDVGHVTIEYSWLPNFITTTSLTGE